ncbi:elongin A, like isoform X2 [Cheilinus undulatus]|uniref:elongin A, like isoform X2 n=1 Tax=Cheilinus undulatus TaxID=241271 RepID=UPI001BD6BD1E|nr:elongin A, like isoform X2 [Cheilinus undulatus]
MMACSSDVVKKVMRFKLQLTDTAESATVVKILQKLKNLEITLDILAETGIGKTVNSLRRHEQAGEFAKSLVRGWKRLIPKESTSQTEGGEALKSLSIKEKPDEDKCPYNGSLTVEDFNNNYLAQHDECVDSPDEDVFKKSHRKAKKQKTPKDQDGCQKEVLEKVEFKEDDMDDSDVSRKKKINKSDRKSRSSDSLSGNRSSDDNHHKSRFHSREKIKRSSESGIFESEKRSNKKLKTSDKSSKEGRHSFSSDSDDKHSKALRRASAKDCKYPEIMRHSEVQNHNRKRKRKGKEKHRTKVSDLVEHKNEKHKEEESESEQPSMSFESYLNYDVNICKRKEKPAVKKTAQKCKTAIKKEEIKVSDIKSAEMDSAVAFPKQESFMDLINVPLPAVLPECEKPSFEKEPDLCDEESAGFTGQRLNKKMQVYSGNKTVFLPAMMSLHQQCIRTLQNNINLLYDTGGVPFDILEPVLERCTPEQLLRIEECNPIYVGETDNLWGKHCQRDFKDSRLLEYESWKEMYMRLSEEREIKLQRLTKSIVSSQSKKPKGRQVKMAFIHTVAKPPRDVRIQQEIHGTAVQQPQQLRCSVKTQDSRPRMICDEPSRTSSTSSGTGNTQDPRKKSRVAPMMAKSLKAFKKQLGRR